MDTCEFWLQVISIGVDAGVGLLTLGALRAAIKANKTANNANEIANKANEIANTANTYTRAEIGQSIDAMLQTKNVELFDKRLSLLNIISDFELKDYKSYFDIRIFDKKLELQLLFRNDKDMINHFDNLKAIVSNIYCIKDDIKYWEEIVTPAVFNEIYKLERETCGYPCDGVSDEKMKEFEEKCEKHSFIPYDDVHEIKEYNYIELSQSLSDKNKEFDATKERLINMMKMFIAASIEEEK